MLFDLLKILMSVSKECDTNWKESDEKNIICSPQLFGL